MSGGLAGRSTQCGPACLPSYLPAQSRFVEPMPPNAGCATSSPTSLLHTPHIHRHHAVPASSQEAPQSVACASVPLQLQNLRCTARPAFRCPFSSQLTTAFLSLRTATRYSFLSPPLRPAPFAPQDHLPSCCDSVPMSVRVLVNAVCPPLLSPCFLSPHAYCCHAAFHTPQPPAGASLQPMC